MTTFFQLDVCFQVLKKQKKTSQKQIYDENNDGCIFYADNLT